MPAALIQRFGNAELDRAASELRIDGKRSPLGPRAVALLALLVSERHRPVPKHELLETVWRGLVVEENNLQVQVSTLRKLLGPQSIATVPGRGYRFMLEVEGDAPEQPGEDASRLRPPEPERGNLPEQLPEMYGREAEGEAVLALLRQHALVTVVGAAGIGKTRLALAVAQAQLATPETYPDGAWVVELAPLNDVRQMVPALSQALRVTLAGLRDPQEELEAALRDHRALVVVDNCEQVIEHAGPLLLRLVRTAPGLRVIATSQEPLRVDGEQVYRLGPLTVPTAAAVVDPISFGAVRLFVERVRALVPRYRLGVADSADVIEICQRLDGLPLAIELAAARVPVLGVAGVRVHLRERFRLLTGGSRVAPKRHQTLRAALDWSLALLDDQERATYRRLGVFVGSFALESAQELASDDVIDPWTVLEHLSSLVEKSLVIAEGEPRPRYRMLESTREHALEQLAGAAETDTWIARHAQTTVRALQRAIEQRRTDLVLAETPNVNSAYQWARGIGDAEAAVSLVTLPSMAIAVEGAADEARARLLEVRPLVTDALPKPLRALYWQWVGRIGLDGRLPAAHCVEAYQRAEGLFLELGNLRHVHACRRHLAEALLESGDPDAAAVQLQRAREMEAESWPLVDRMRRLRVEGLWHAESGRSEEALVTSTMALEMAQLAGIGRYELVLLDDIARIQLEAGHADDAARRYRVLAERALGSPSAGLTRANALAGLVAALTAKGDLTGASATARQAIPALRRSGVFLGRADILAQLMARLGRYEFAAHLLGASDKFRADIGMPRGPMEQACRDEALQQLSNEVGTRRRAAWLAVGAAAGEDVLANSALAQLDLS